MKYITPIILAAVLMAGCATSQIAKAQKAVATVQADSATLSADSTKALAAVAAVSGSNAKVSNVQSYIVGLNTSVQTYGPLLSALISLIPTTSGTSAAAAASVP